MAVQSPRNFTHLAIAIVVAALVISASFVFVETDMRTSVPNDVIGTTTIVSTTTFTTTSTSTLTQTMPTTLDGSSTSVSSDALSDSTTNSTCPPLVGCGPYPSLAISGANAQVDSNGPTTCQRTNFTAVCSIYILSGDSGEVMVNVTLQGVQPGTYVGGDDVAFLVYSSASSYVSFTSVPACAYFSGPNLDIQGCNIPSNSMVQFQFSFSVSPSLANSTQKWSDSVTVSMWQTCCFP